MLHKIYDYTVNSNIMCNFISNNYDYNEFEGKYVHVHGTWGAMTLETYILTKQILLIIVKNHLKIIRITVKKKWKQ